MGRFSRPAPIAPLTIGSLLTNLQELTMHDQIEASALRAWPALSLHFTYLPNWTYATAQSAWPLRETTCG